MLPNTKVRLSDPPYLQIAIDLPDLLLVESLLNKISQNKRLILEIGTPLLKNEGLKHTANVFRKTFPKNYVVADLKTLDVGSLEVKLAKENNADGCVVSGLAPIATVKEFAKACGNEDIDMWIDSLGTSRQRFLNLLQSIDDPIEVVIIHRGIDEEISNSKRDDGLSWNDISIIKRITNCKVAVAGGITPDNVNEALNLGADIIIVGRFIYSANNPQESINTLLKNF
ncbi:MAG: orotidine 5'-phosphate decarboxylase / HUMPS family protein [Candidatus Hodarchaeales archaeon]